MKTKPLSAVIRTALDRECIKMEEEYTGLIGNQWKGTALASWLAPGVIRSVERYLAKHLPKPKRRTK